MVANGRTIPVSVFVYDSVIELINEEKKNIPLFEKKIINSDIQVSF